MSIVWIGHGKKIIKGLAYAILIEILVTTAIFIVIQHSSLR